MKFVDTLKRSGRNLKNAKARTLLTACAIAVGGFTLTLTLAAATGARQFTDRLVQANFDPKAVFVAKDEAFFGANNSQKPREYSNDLSTANGLLVKQLTPEDIVKIEQLPHVVQVLPGYNVAAQYITRDGAKKYTGAVNLFDPASKPDVVAGTVPAELPADAVLLPDDYLTPLNFSSAQQAIGKPVTIQVRQVTGKTLAKTYTVAAVTTKSSLSIDFNPTGPYVSLGTLKELNTFINAGLVNSDLVPTLTVRGDGVAAETLKDEITKAGFQARTAKDLQSFINQIITVLQSVIIVFGLITLVASFFGVVNTQYISVLERTREIGLMKALGTSRAAVSRLFMIEATWIGFIGAALGAAVAVIVGTALNPWISKKLEFGSEHLLVFEPAQIALLVVFLMLVTTIAGLLPARKAAKLDPIEALRTE
jgi:putative ABC transport system permease protein